MPIKPLTKESIRKHWASIDALEGRGPGGQLNPSYNDGHAAMAIKRALGVDSIAEAKGKLRTAEAGLVAYPHEPQGQPPMRTAQYMAQVDFAELEMRYFAGLQQRDPEAFERMVKERFHGKG